MSSVLAIGALRTTLFFPLDDLLTITHEFINSKVSRSGLLRCLKRHKVSNLRALQNALTDENSSSLPSKAKTFKNYEPGFLHMDIGILANIFKSKAIFTALKTYYTIKQKIII